MFKIQLVNGDFYKSKSARVQHYKTAEKATAKIAKLGEIAAGAKVVESKSKTAASKTEKPEERATDTKVVKAKKTAAKVDKPDKSASGKGKKAKKNKNQ